MIDELLKKFAESAQKWGWEESDTQPSQDVKTAKSQLLAEILKVIGEDEFLGNLKWCTYRNELRAEQRTKLKELFNVKEKL